VKYRDQIVCGVLVAGSSFAVYELTRAVYFLPAGALVGNVWDAVRRSRRRRVGDVQASFFSSSIT
jgi:hypothetical protein